MPTLQNSRIESRKPVISAVVLAAGASRRMVVSKVMLPWENTTVIGKVVTTLIDSGVECPVVVTGRSAEDVHNALGALNVNWVHNPDYETTEMLASLRLGLRKLPENADACFIVLGDQPQIQQNTIVQLMSAFSDHSEALIIPSYQLRRGHPWLLRRNLWSELHALPGNATLRQFINSHTNDIFYLNVDTPSVLMDLDTPEDYKRSRSEGN